MNGFPIITVLTLLPVIGGIVILGFGEQQKCLPRKFALGFSFGALALAIWMWAAFDPASSGPQANPAQQGLQFIEQHTWIPSLGVQYFVGVDGLGLLLVLLTAIVTPLAVLASGRVGQASRLPSERGSASDSTSSGGAGETPALPSAPLYYALILFLQAGLFGTFTALNFFHWFIFWELSLIPAFFLIRLWGGPLRAPAATQFFIYTMVGSVAMLLAFLAIFLATRKGSEPGVFDFPALAALARSGGLKAAFFDNFGWKLFGMDFTVGGMIALIFGGVLLGFAVKVPMIPFHTWLPPAYSEAPTPVTMLLTGVMSKMGIYGFVRVLLPVFSEQLRDPRVRTVMLSLAVATIVLSAFAAFAQRDLKRILAYSSINHLGYCLLAIFAVATPMENSPWVATQQAAALNGVFLQTFNHGLTAATLFLFVHLLERRSGGLRGLDDFGGLRKVAPVFCGLMGISLFSSLGLPGLNGFVGEFLIFKGVFPLAPWAAAVSVIGLLVTAIFILTILQRVFNGPLNEKWSKLPDLTLGERALVAVPIALMFVLGVWPRLVLDVVNPTVLRMVEHLKIP